MRNIYTGILIGALTTIIIWSLLMALFIPKVDLPEEYQLISHNSTHPEQLVGYYDKYNVLHIGFKH